jgi:chromatin remodeling complex protein RSC6
MPKRTSKTPATETQQLSADVSATIDTVTAIVAPVEKKTRKPKVVAPVSVAPIEQETDNVVIAAAESVVESSDNVETPLSEQSVDFIAQLQQLGLLISSLKTNYRLLEKKWGREIKIAQKLSSKRKRKAGNRAPSGFVKPTKISDELAGFLGKDKGTEMARTDVTREINTYIRANNLQDKENGRKINPDNKLAVLLKLKKTDELTYFNLQKYMSHHFAKSVKPEVVVAAVVSASV